MRENAQYKFRFNLLFQKRFACLCESTRDVSASTLRPGAPPRLQELGTGTGCRERPSPAPGNTRIFHACPCGIFDERCKGCCKTGQCLSFAFRKKEACHEKACRRRKRRRCHVRKVLALLLFCLCLCFGFGLQARAAGFIVEEIGTGREYMPDTLTYLAEAKTWKLSLADGSEAAFVAKALPVISPAGVLRFDD